MPFSDLPTLAEVQAARAFKPCPKGKTRLELVEAERKLTTVSDKAFRDAVWTHDKARCRCCGRKVAKVLSLVPERGEVHHVCGRTGDLRFEPKCALLLCKKCHERVTGRVNDKLVIVASKTFKLRGGLVVTDARAKVFFREV